jgi:serine/threonine protein kinase
MEWRKDETLPSGRAAVTIPVKDILPSRPQAPDVRHDRSESLLPSNPPPTTLSQDQKEPILRAREEEKAAYGRVFVGCGKREDYELTTKLGEGTFGEVHKAIHRTTQQAVALKRILMHNEKEGMPVTALREIKMLKVMKHPSIIDLLDMFVVRSKWRSFSLRLSSYLTLC